jgi:hypothetical protein
VLFQRYLRRLGREYFYSFFDPNPRQIVALGTAMGRGEAYL